MKNEINWKGTSIRLPEEMDDAVKQAAQESGRNISEEIRYRIRLGLTEQITEQNRQVIREVVRDEIKRSLDPAVERIVKLIIKTFMEAAHSNAYNQDVLRTLYYDDSLTQDENDALFADLYEKTRLKAIQTLKQRVEV